MFPVAAVLALRYCRLRGQLILLCRAASVLFQHCRSEIFDRRGPVLYVGLPELQEATSQFRESVHRTILFIVHTPNGTAAFQATPKQKTATPPRRGSGTDDDRRRAFVVDRGKVDIGVGCSIAWRHIGSAGYANENGGLRRKRTRPPLVPCQSCVVTSRHDRCPRRTCTAIRVTDRGLVRFP